MPGERLPTPLLWPENSMDFIVHGVPKSQKWLSYFHFGCLGGVHQEQEQIYGQTIHSILVLWRLSVSSWIFSFEGQEKHYSKVTDLMSSAKQSHKQGWDCRMRKGPISTFQSNYFCLIFLYILSLGPGIKCQCLPAKQKANSRQRYWNPRAVKRWGPLQGSITEGNGTPLQYSCLENPMDRGAW